MLRCSERSCSMTWRSRWGPSADLVGIFLTLVGHVGGGRGGGAGAQLPNAHTCIRTYTLASNRMLPRPPPRSPQSQKQACCEPAHSHTTHHHAPVRCTSSLLCPAHDCRITSMFLGSNKKLEAHTASLWLANAVGKHSFLTASRLP